MYPHNITRYWQWYKLRAYNNFSVLIVINKNDLKSISSGELIMVPTIRYNDIVSTAMLPYRCYKTVRCQYCTINSSTDFLRLLLLLILQSSKWIATDLPGYKGTVGGRNAQVFLGLLLLPCSALRSCRFIACFFLLQ